VIVANQEAGEAGMESDAERTKTVHEGLHMNNLPDWLEMSLGRADAVGRSGANRLGKAFRICSWALVMKGGRCWTLRCARCATLATKPQKERTRGGGEAPCGASLNYI